MESGEKEDGEQENEIEKALRSKASVLLLGGCGFVGRNFLLFLLNEQLISYVKVVDKITPLMAYMHPLHMTCFDSPLVEFQQADLTQFVFLFHLRLTVFTELIILKEFFIHLPHHFGVRLIISPLIMFSILLRRHALINQSTFTPPDALI
jgi:hypothetical protein